MTKKYRLEDLFVVGQELTIEDARNGRSVTVWLQKLNSLEHEKAMRRASAARSRVLSGREESELEMAQDEAGQLGREGWVEYLTADALNKKIPSIESELAAEEEWAESDYIQGLRDVWDATMRYIYEDDPLDAEASKIKEELKRFRDELEKRIDGERESIRRDFETKNSEDLERRVVDRLIQARGDMVWLAEFRKCEIWLATREPDDHHQLYFESRETVDKLSHEVLVQLMSAYQELSVEPIEGKDLGATHNSSASSESPEQQETDDSSGPAELTESKTSPTT